MYYVQFLDDVKLAILFANKYNVQPILSSSGHDFFGRCNGDRTLHINLARMKNWEVNHDDSRSPSDISARMGPAVVLVDMYKEVPCNSERFILSAMANQCPWQAST